jgi:mannose/fructose/N-acetylgalactosamine-specific phosphotransferase system component IIC
MTKQKSITEITFKALLGAWATLVFGTSMLIYFFSSVPHKFYHQNPVVNILRNIWEIADEMGPAVKISIIIVFGILVLLFKSTISKNQIFFYLGSTIVAIISVSLVLALLPSDLSRGYGIGLTGARFDIKMIPIYLLGAVWGGAVFAYIYTELSISK